MTETRRVQRSPNRKFQLVGARQLAAAVSLSVVEVWEEPRPEVEHMTGLATFSF
jgi:hypothetical protein